MSDTLGSEPLRKLGHTVLGWVLNPMTGVLIRKENVKTQQSHKKESHVRYSKRLEFGYHKSRKINDCQQQQEARRTKKRF